MSQKLVVSDGVVAGNAYDKYGTKNPVERRLMSGFLRGLDSLLDQAGPMGSVLEVGCGEGHITARMVERYGRDRVTASDLSPEILDIARRGYPGLRFERQSVYDVGMDGRKWDLIVACEVFEHLDDPRRALRALAGAANRAIILSVPREPIWRALNLARGKYWSRMGNTPGHVQQWSTKSFLAFLGQEVDVRDSNSPLPWTQALCAPRPSA
ncbi:MAG: class I SAM-dependent methyltransferase [Candidatus Eisenbacteria bacterium]